MTISMNKKLAEEKIKLSPDGFLLPAGGFGFLSVPNL